MGMSASQARLLNLTSRMHDIEYKAQKLEAQKLQMANESTQVYKEYEDALNMVKVQQKQIANDGSASFIDASYNSLKEAGYLMTYVDKGNSYYIATQTEHQKFGESYSAIDFACKMCNPPISTSFKNYLDNYCDYVLVTTAQEFIDAANAGVDIMLMNDIDFSSIEPKKSGSNYVYYIESIANSDINGNGYAIKGLKASLCKTLSNSIVDNITLDASINTDAKYVGAVSGEASGNVYFINVAINGSITSSNGSSRVGALIGNANGTNVKQDGITNSTNISANNGNGTACLSGGTNGTWNNINVLNTGTYTFSDGVTKQASSFSTANATGATLTNKLSIENNPEIAKYMEVYNKMKVGYKVESDVIENQYKNSTLWLSNLLQNGDLLLSKLDNTTLTYYDVNVATDTALQEVSDETALKKAEAKYEADMRKINQKDTKFDTDLAAMETERNAVKTEMDTLKTVAKDNVDRTFKLFS